MTFFEEIDLLIDKKRQEYSEYPNRIVSDYTEENRLKDDYQDRQILELLQNAEDAGSSEVLIRLDKNEKYLLVANKGNESFTVEGIESLMLANYSSKSRVKYIGNKGLGFRSILNWADEVHIIANDCEIKFSKSIVADEFLKLDISAKERDKLINKKGLSKQHPPIAILSIPNIDKVNNESNWLTTIKIFYDENQEIQIENQLKEFSPETLLFLKNIKVVLIEGVGEQIVHQLNSIKNSDKVLIGEDIWELKNLALNRSDILPDEYQDFNTEERLHYNVQIAIKEGELANNYKLHNYFPTELTINLPCILHGTFDLDSSRNHSKLTPRNEFILDKLIELTRNTALELCNRELGWNGYRLLTATEDFSDSALIQSFYRKIRETKVSLAIYPSVDKNYYKIDDIKFYGDDFSKWVVRNNVSDHFPALLFPLPENTQIKIKDFVARYSVNEFILFVENISGKISSIEERVSLISILLKEPFKMYHKVYYPLLMDNTEKVIPSDTQVFTMERGSVEKYLIPEFSKMSFISSDFYKDLIGEFEEEIKSVRIKEEDLSRPLKRLLDPILNIGSNDILDIVKNLISSQNTYIENWTKGNILLLDVGILNSHILSLFRIFCENEDREGVIKGPILLSNREGHFVKSNDLFLGNEFPTGRIAEEIFSGIYTSGQYLNTSYLLLLQDENINLSTIENFFYWLGVNKFVRFKTIDAPKEQGLDRDYIKYVYKKINKSDHPFTGQSFKGLAIDSIEEYISRLTYEKLIVLILKEVRIKQRLDFANTDDQLKYSYVNWYDIYPKPSYIYYQLSKYFKFENYLIDNANFSFINSISIDYSNPIFIKNNIGEQDINQVLLLLGAKTAFSQLNPSYIYEILHRLEISDIEGKTTQAFYRIALNALEKIGYEPLPGQLDNLRVFAKTRDNRSGKWEFANKIYYSNDIVLPASIIKNQFILNVPKRFGEEKVVKYFGVNTFSDFRLDIINDTVESNELLTVELTTDLEKLRPYFLSYRLKDILNDKGQKEAANQLKNYTIKLIHKGSYQTKDDSEIALKFSEFVRQESVFYLCIENETSLNVLKNHPRFCDSISEILCLVSKVWDHRDQFRIAYKYGIKELEHQFETTGEDQLLLKAKELLGISLKEIHFWNAIATMLGKELPEDNTDVDRLRILLLDKFNYELPEYYLSVNFESFDNLQSSQFLNHICVEMKLTLSQIHQYCSSFTGLFNWHLAKYRQVALDVEVLWNQAWWIYFSKKLRTEQRCFVSKRKIYNQKINEIIFELAKGSSFDIELNYERSLITCLTKKYNIEIDKDCLKDIIIENKYPEIFSETKLLVNELDDEIQSLVFFEDNYESLKTYMGEADLEDDVNEKSSNDIPIDIVRVYVIPVSLSKGYGAVSNSINSFSSKKNGVHSEKADNQKKEAGQKAEKLVRDKLISIYPEGEVFWISGNSRENRLPLDDSKGYDIRYKKDKNISEWNYLEVKSISGDSFIISSNEVNVGIKNKELYHLALVKDSAIYLVEDFFLDPERVEEFNSLSNNPSIKPLDYQIYFQLPHLNENIVAEKNFVADEIE
ncbi:MAG: DUF3883 domain-containing protein [Opitutaceae bacterium]|nr:DUF3883 domain-containing protein [Cytophagales bacterium]